MQSSALPAPTSGLVRQSFEDIDQQAQCLTGYDQKYQQLSRGQFNGQFSTLLLGAELGLYFEKLNQLLDQSGSIPRDQYSVIFLMNKGQPCKLNGRDFSSDDLFFGRPGASFQTCLEQSPGMYLRLVRLNEIRRALQSSRNNQRSIGDIAAEWGVWHLSRLAQYYSLQFGELPSQTRENQLVR